MKKLIVLLGMMMLLIPFNSYAETEWHRYVHTFTGFECLSYMESNLNYGTEVSYENGVYTISGDVSGSLIREWDENRNDHQFAFSCLSSSLECSKHHLFIRSTHCRRQTGGSGYPGIAYQDGFMFDGNPVFYVGKSYTKENGVYTLVDYEEHNMTDIDGEAYLSENFEGYYLCAGDFRTSCSTLYYIAEVGNTNSGQKFSHVADVDEYYLVSDSYIKEDNTFRLLNPQKAILAADGGVTGYTCRSKEDFCEQLYKIRIGTSYEAHDGGRETTLEALTIENDSMEKTIKLKETFDIETFFNEEEVATAFSTNPEVADIVNQKLVLYRVGETDLIYEDDFTYKVIHLKVTEDALPIQNPKTGRYYIFVLVILLGVFSLLTKAIQKRREE